MFQTLAASYTDFGFCYVVVAIVALISVAALPLSRWGNAAHPSLGANLIAIAVSLAALGFGVWMVRDDHLPLQDDSIRAYVLMLVAILSLFVWVDYPFTRVMARLRARASR